MSRRDRRSRSRSRSRSPKRNDFDKFKSYTDRMVNKLYTEVSQQIDDLQREINCSRHRPEKGDKGDKGSRGCDGQKGNKGERGRTGPPPLVGAGRPSSREGRNGDVYIDVRNGDLYLKEDGSWNLDGNIAGPKGDKGDKGDSSGKGDKGDKGDPGNNGLDGAKGEPGINGTKGDKGDPATRNSMFAYSNTNQYDAGHSTTLFLPIAFPLPLLSPLTPIAGSWVRDANNYDFSGAVSGFYNITYNVDVFFDGAGTSDIAIVLTSAPTIVGPWTVIPGSASQALAPVNNHINNITKKVMFQYTAGTFIRAWFWSNDSGSQIGDIVRLTGLLPNPVPSAVPETTAALTISQISQ